LGALLYRLLGCWLQKLLCWLLAAAVVADLALAAWRRNKNNT
jgi:hypothetical protein